MLAVVIWGIWEHHDDGDRDNGSDNHNSEIAYGPKLSQCSIYILTFHQDSSTSEREINTGEEGA